LRFRNDKDWHTEDAYLPEEPNYLRGTNEFDFDQKTTPTYYSKFKKLLLSSK